jgi:hypothetical protein
VHSQYSLLSKKKFRTILRRFSDLQDYQELLSSLGVRLSKASIFEFGIAGLLWFVHKP